MRNLVKAVGIVMVLFGAWGLSQTGLDALNVGLVLFGVLVFLA